MSCNQLGKIGEITEAVIDALGLTKLPGRFLPATVPKWIAFQDFRSTHTFIKFKHGPLKPDGVLV